MNSRRCAGVASHGECQRQIYRIVGRVNSRGHLSSKQLRWARSQRLGLLQSYFSPRAIGFWDRPLQEQRAIVREPAKVGSRMADGPAAAALSGPRADVSTKLYGARSPNASSNPSSVGTQDGRWTSTSDGQLGRLIVLPNATRDDGASPPLLVHRAMAARASEGCSRRASLLRSGLCRSCCVLRIPSHVEGRDAEVGSQSPVAKRLAIGGPTQRRPRCKTILLSLAGRSPRGRWLTARG